MASWRFSVGNLVSRAAAPPVAVSPAAEDPLLPFEQWGTGYPDEQGGFGWRNDGTYAADLDLNLLADESDRSDAPTGWLDLPNLLGGTPGLPANPPDWGTYGSRTPALRFYRPVVQEVDVMPGESVKLEVGIYRPSGASGSSGTRVRVVDRSTGKGWDGGYGVWLEGGVVTEQTSSDSWLDVADEIEADPDRTERTTYLVIIEPMVASGIYDATTYAYAAANGAGGSPALYAEVDTVALIGHEIPADAEVSLVPQAVGGTALTLTMAQPSCYAVGVAAQLVRTWRLSIQMPGGVQPRPVIGELWIGKARIMLVGSPVPTFGGEETAAGQLRVEGPRKRVEVVSDGARPVLSLDLSFRARDDASFRQLREEVLRLTRYGTDPLLILPGERFEGAGRVYHGRVEDRLSWSVITPTEEGSARSFAMPFLESPFAGG